MKVKQARVAMSSPNIIPLICYQQKLFLRALLILKVKLLLLPITKKTTFFKKEKEAYQEIDGLDDIQEHLILPVLDALGTPGHCVGDSGRGPRGPRFQLVAFLSDVPVGPGSELSGSGTDIFENSPSL